MVDRGIVVVEGSDGRPEWIESVLRERGIVGRLSVEQLRVLWRLVEVSMEGEGGDEEVARRAGVEEGFIRQCRADPDFGEALAEVMGFVVRGHSDRVVQNLLRLGQRNVHANKILAEMAGIYRPEMRVRQVTLHGRLGDWGGAGDAIDRFLVRLIELGWTPENVADRMRQLMEEGAG